MDWDPQPVEEIDAWVLDEIFDRAKGWTIPEEQASLKRIISMNGVPTYIVKVGDIEVVAWEQHVWADAAVHSVSAGRLCATVAFTGITIHTPQKLLEATFDGKGIPSYGMNKANGQPTLHTAFPIAPNFPVDIARRQLMVCIGTLVKEASTLLVSWSKNSGPAKQPADRDQAKKPANWDQARNIAAIAGTFLRAFAGL
ncbi:MAG TPA: hypothetical protein VGJ19_06950 [Streptosporangiaceae bacterium]|jgi:hypothetical protein